MKKQRRVRLILFFSTFLIFLTGCNKSKDQYSYEQKAPTPESRELKSSVENENVSSTGSIQKIDDKIPNQNNINGENKRMIIRSGKMNIEVEKYDDAEKKVTESANKFSGYVTNTTSDLSANGKKQGSITVRIPSQKFDAFISDISLTGKVMSQNISGTDVTTEYIDLEARQKTQRELEKRLLELLSEKTAKLVDVVQVEEKLSSVRENIERTEGRMRFLKDQSSYSTLTVSLFEPSLLQTSSGGGFFYEIEQGFKRGLEGFTEVFSLLITFIISFLPLFVFLSIIFFLARKFWRNRKLKKVSIHNPVI